MSIQHTAKGNSELSEFGLENPLKKHESNYLSEEYHYNILKGLSTYRSMWLDKLRKWIYLYVFVEYIGNKDLLILQKHYGKYLVTIYRNNNGEDLKISIYLGKKL